MSSPRRHAAHCRQPTHGHTTRGAPIGTPAAAGSSTPGPTAATLPTGSWPSVSGSFTPRSASTRLRPPPMSKYPVWMCRSLWHTPHDSTSTSTSVPRGSGVG